MAPSTVHLVFGYISSMFAAAVVDRLIGSTPCTGIRLPDIPRTEYFIPTAEQVHALAEAIMPRYRAAVLLAAGTGLRPGEVTGLERRHIDFLRREVHVEQQVVKPVGKAAYIGPLKTATSRRVVELPDVVIEALARHVAVFPPATVMELEDRNASRKGHKRSAELLFTTSNGALRSTSPTLDVEQRVGHRAQEGRAAR